MTIAEKAGVSRNPFERIFAALIDPAKSERTMLILLAGYAAAWSLYGAIAKGSQDLHFDIGEMFAWSHQVSFSAPTHPPLGAWLVRAWFAVMPRQDSAFYLFGILLATAALWIASWQGIPYLVLLVALCTFAAEFVMRRTRYGAELYAINCSPCHGARMQEPGAAFNLRKFPPDQRERFVNSVTRGKNQMPPWGDFFKPEQLEALWAYVTTGER